MEAVQYIQSYLREMGYKQKIILNYIENEDIDEGFQDIIDIFNTHMIQADQYKLKEILHIICQISNNHHRCKFFFEKFQKIIKYLQKDINHHFSNHDIFNIFHSNKRMLLMLFEEKIIFPDKIIKSIITNDKYLIRNYPEYFYPEFEKYYDSQFNEQLDPQIVESSRNNYDIFNAKRKVGENDDYLCELIRNDSIKEFITLENQLNISATTVINHSIYETNLFLLKKKKVTVIKYASFFGSIQIIKYLQMKKAIIKKSLLYYSIHSCNQEMFHFIEEKHLLTSKEYFESIKCHNQDFIEYTKSIMNEYLLIKYILYAFLICLKSYNFIDIEERMNLLIRDVFDYYKDKPKDKENPEFFLLYLFNTYDYYNIVKYLMQFPQVDLTSTDPIIGEPINVLHNAVQKGNKELVKLFLSKNVIDINQKTRKKIQKEEKMPIYDIKSPLDIACEKGNFEIVQILLSVKDIDINSKAIQRSYLPTSYQKYLKEESPLIIAVSKGNFEIVDLLLAQKKIDVNILFKESCTPNGDDKLISEYKTILNIAIEKGYFNIIQLLLSRNDIDFNHENIYQQSIRGCFSYELQSEVKKNCYEIAIEKGNQQIIELIKSHSRINANKTSK